jgi:hypothetical protein
MWAEGFAFVEADVVSGRGVETSRDEVFSSLLAWIISKQLPEDPHSLIEAVEDRPNTTGPFYEECSVI